jgi:hypothetical protein
MNPMPAQLAAISKWIDKSNSDKDPEAVLWGRVAKIGEEFGEVIEALIGYTNQNPRKGITHGIEHVRKELLDVALTALCAFEHVTSNSAISLAAFETHIQSVYDRAVDYETRKSGKL